MCIQSSCTIVYNLAVDRGRRSLHTEDRRAVEDVSPYRRTDCVVLVDGVLNIALFQTDTGITADDFDRDAVGKQIIIKMLKSL